MWHLLGVVECDAVWFKLRPMDEYSMVWRLLQVAVVKCVAVGMTAVVVWLTVVYVRVG